MGIRQPSTQRVRGLIKHVCKLTVLASFAPVLLMPSLGVAQEGGSCAFLCMPELKIEPTITFENLGNRARVEVGGVIEETKREAVFELIFALEVPTEIPRVGVPDWNRR